MSQEQDAQQASPEIHGNGSVAHQIIGQFLSSLEREEGYAEISRKLRVVLLESKPTEATVRGALFGDDSL